MCNLFIDAIEIRIHTNGGEFGTRVDLSRGLNIIRARNSTGKSTILNSILYALGMEEVLGGKGAQVMKPVLKDELEYRGRMYTVLESFVTLQISNQKESVTLVRWIKSTSFDDKLIRVHYGPLLTQNSNYATTDMFVHLPGSAQNELGFHNFLADFIGWKLPEVPSYDGGIRKLYMQTLIPWLFIEQLKGWSTLYVAPSTNFGIRDLIRRTLEFILDLDVIENSKKRDELLIERSVIANKWGNTIDSLMMLSTDVNGVLSNASKKPTLSVRPSLLVFDDNKNLIDVPSRLYQLREKVTATTFRGREVGEVIEQQESQISEVEQEILIVQDRASSIRRQLFIESSSKEIIISNIVKLESDLEKHRDVKRLYSLGSDLDASLSHGLCPTCLQPIQDSLLPQEADIQPMSLDANIRYIGDQLNALRFALDQSLQIIENYNIQLHDAETTLKTLRRKSRLIRLELRNDPRNISESELDDVVDKKMELANLERTYEKFNHVLTILDDLQNEWSTYLSSKEQLPEEYFSVNDKKKLNRLQTVFRSQLQKFDFQSISVDEINISEDKYVPTINGFDIKVDSSASDHIRLIWAFTISLEIVSNEYGGNHPKILVMDEPGQHQMNNLSQGQLFKTLRSIGGQSIIGSSLSVQDVMALLSEDDKSSIKLLDLGDDHIIKPLQ